MQVINIRPIALFYLLKKQTLLKVYTYLLYIHFTILNNEAKEEYYRSLVTNITKSLGYKNKSTVSRALKELRKYGYVTQENTPSITTII